MTKKQLIKQFEGIREKYKGDKEAIHGRMDAVMLDYINNPRITELFNMDAKWCA